MKISPPERFETTIGGKTVHGLAIRLTEERTGSERRIWVAVDAEHARHLSTRQDVFLPSLVFHAMLIGEDLDLGGLAVEEFFLRNVSHAASQYGHWFHKLRVPKISNPSHAGRAPRGGGFAAFCSGGVDGSFSVYRHTRNNPADVSRSREQDLGHAYHVLYSDEPEGIAGHGKAADALAEATASWGVQLIRVYTNIYLFAPVQTQNYAMVSHGAAFASLAHALSAETGATLLASSHTDGYYHPYGSTPEVDPMFSSGSMAFINDGGHYTRAEKVECLCGDAAARRALNVCDRRAPMADYKNCSRCHKCLRTMITIDLYGKAGAATPAFDWRDYSPEAFGRLQLRGVGIGDEQFYAEEIRDAAVGKRPDIVVAANRAAVRSRMFKPMFMVEDIAKKLPIGARARQSLKGIKKQMLSLIGSAR